MEVNNPEKTYQNSSEEFQLPITLPQPTINPPEIFKNHSIENTSDNIEKNGDFFEFLNDESKISNFLEKLERTENKISNMREIIKLQENDIIYEESRRIISKIDTNLMKTQEKFFKQTKTIDEEIKNECEMKTLECFTNNEILLSENKSLKETLAIKTQNYNALFNNFKALQNKNSQNELLISERQSLLKEKDNKIEELQKKIEDLLENMQKIPSTVNQTMNNSPIREDNISLANSNNEQNIEFIENGIEQVFLTQDSKKVANLEKEIKKMELDESLWLVSKEKEFNFELTEFLDNPPQAVKKLPPILSKSQQLYMQKHQKLRQPMTDQNKNKEIVNSKPKQIKSLTQKPIPFERKPKQIEINPQLKQNSEMLKPNNFHQLDNKNDETAEVLRLFNSSHLRNSFNSKKEIHDPILPVNITNTSLFSHKAGKDKGTDYNSRTPFTKVKGISIQESLMKEQPNGPIFDYNKNN